MASPDFAPPPNLPARGEGDGRPNAPTLENVAAVAGVSRSTASRAINGGHRVSPAAQAAVDAAIATLGYTPNRAARSLVTRRADSVALIVPEPDERVLSDPYFAGALRGISAALEPTNIQLILLIARRSGGIQRTAHYLLNRHVDGAIVVSHHRDDALNRVLLESQLPCVFVGRPWVPAGNMTYVDLDNELGGQLATEHLIQSGCTRIATIAGPLDMAAGVDRLAGWRTALRTAGLSDALVAQGDFTSPSGAQATEELLAAHPDIDGIFVASDLMAIGALNALARHNRSVPGDVRVVGFDDLGVASSTSPALTTISNPVVEMSRAAGDALLARLTGQGKVNGSQIFKPKLVVRESA